MALLTTLTFLLCLLWPSTGAKIDVEELVPRFMDRMKEVREILLPVPEETLKEGLYYIGSNYIPLDSKTELCRNHSNLMFESFLNFDLWALRMVDASSKVPSGLLDGNIMDLGSYDQCLSVEAPEKLFSGQMCVVETKGFLPDAIDTFNTKRPFLPTIRIDILMTFCVPSSCTPQDVQTHLNVAFNSVNASAFVYESSCSSKVPVPMEAKEWIAIFVIVFIVVLVVVSTLYDSPSMDIESRSLDKNPLFCAFSLRKNYRQMISTQTSTAALTCLNGLRVFAMLWVMTGHRMLQMLSFPKIRPREIYEGIDTFAMAPVENTQLALDIFFLISGILVTYGFLRHMRKGHKFNIFYFYLYRYLRLTPALAVIVLFYATIAVRFSDGPLWRRFFELLNSSCRCNWWTTLLYINNYYDPYNLCVTQSWYLSSDFQLYLFSPVLLIPLLKRPKLGLLLTAVLMVISTIFSLWNAIANDLNGAGFITLHARKSEDALVKHYLATHWRAASFLMGMVLGYDLFKIKQGELILKLSRAKLWGGWLVSIIFILFSVFYITVIQDPAYEGNRWVDIPYVVFNRHLLTLGFVWIILVCTLGHGGCVDQFLSWRVLVPFARLTYGAFLTHMMVQFFDNYSQRSAISINHVHLWYHVSADFTISYLTSAVLYLTVEGPCSNITAWCFEGNKKPKNDVESQAAEPAQTLDKQTRDFDIKFNNSKQQ